MNYTNYTASDFICDESFLRYFLKEDQNDIVLWQHWIINHPEKTDEVNEAIQMLEVFTLNLPQAEFEQELAKMKGHIYGTPIMKTNTLRLSPREEGEAKGKGKWSLLQSRVAAVIVGAVAVTAAVFLAIDRNQVEPAKEVANRLITKQNPKGQKSLIQLTDGSIVNLNASSEIKFLESFPKDIREIELNGEAFFEVASDAQRPFVVKIGDMSIKALGTSFNVRAYGEDEPLKVALVTGKVEVTIHENSSVNKFFLTHGEEIVFDEKNNVIKKERFDPEFTLAWRKGVLYFKNASWNRIVLTLERWYDVDLEVKNTPLASSSYTGQFDNQSLGVVLESLSFSKDFTYQINGKKIKIDFSPQP